MESTEIFSYLGSGKDENMDHLVKLKQKIQNMVEWIKIYPLENYRELDSVSII